MAPPQWQKGTVVDIIQETWNPRRYFIRVEDSEKFDFVAGQFVTLDLPIGERPAQRWRSYSIANNPGDTNVIELLVALLEGGAGTTYLFNEVKVGSQLSLRGPHGFFTLPETLDTDLFLICTGAGLAPFRSMIQDVSQTQKPHQNIYLIYGCRTQRDLLYYDELSRLDAEMEKFNFIPTLSREQWDGRTGYVHPVYEEICDTKASQSGDAPKPALFYLCGWKFMINDAYKNLTDRGYDKKSIKFELYG
ncbi:MAG TPA: FAD-binding oxidoreductase [Ginsengibacter sp.]|nr:FAD-binding oxidoreductase [Ginsengibacter sp.]